MNKTKNKNHKPIKRKIFLSTFLGMICGAGIAAAIIIPVLLYGCNFKKANQNYNFLITTTTNTNELFMPNDAIGFNINFKDKLPAHTDINIHPENDDDLFENGTLAFQSSNDSQYKDGSFKISNASFKNSFSISLKTLNPFYNQEYGHIVKLLVEVVLNKGGVVAGTQQTMFLLATETSQSISPTISANHCANFIFAGNDINSGTYSVDELKNYIDTTFGTFLPSLGAKISFATNASNDEVLAKLHENDNAVSILANLIADDYLSCSRFTSAQLANLKLIYFDISQSNAQEPQFNILFTQRDNERPIPNEATGDIFYASSERIDDEFSLM